MEDPLHQVLQSNMMIISDLGQLSLMESRTYPGSMGVKEMGDGAYGSGYRAASESSGGAVCGVM